MIQVLFFASSKLPVVGLGQTQTRFRVRRLKHLEPWYLRSGHRAGVVLRIDTILMNPHAHVRIDEDSLSDADSDLKDTGRICVNFKAWRWWSIGQNHRQARCNSCLAANPFHRAHQIQGLLRPCLLTPPLQLLILQILFLRLSKVFSCLSHASKWLLLGILWSNYLQSWSITINLSRLSWVTSQR